MEVTGNTPLSGRLTQVFSYGLWHEDLVMGHELVQFTVTPKISSLWPYSNEPWSQTLKGQVSNWINLDTWKNGFIAFSNSMPGELWQGVDRW